MTQEEQMYQVQKILDKKVTKGKTYYKVKWVGYSIQEATWQSKPNLKYVPKMIKQFQNQYLQVTKNSKKNAIEEKDTADNQIYVHSSENQNVQILPEFNQNAKSSKNNKNQQSQSFTSKKQNNESGSEKKIDHAFDFTFGKTKNINLTKYQIQQPKDTQDKEDQTCFQEEDKDQIFILNQEEKKIYQESLVFEDNRKQNKRKRKANKSPKIENIKPLSKKQKKQQKIKIKNNQKQSQQKTIFSKKNQNISRQTLNINTIEKSQQTLQIDSKQSQDKISQKTNQLNNKQSENSLCNTYLQKQRFEAPKFNQQSQILVKIRALKKQKGSENNDRQYLLIYKSNQMRILNSINLMMAHPAQFVEYLQEQLQKVK